MFLKASKEDFSPIKETSADKKWTIYIKNTQKKTHIFMVNLSPK